MKVEPWKLMIGLALLLVVIGAYSAIGTREPAELVQLLILVLSFIILMVLGYKLGNCLGDRLG